MKYKLNNLHIRDLKKPAFGKNPQADWKSIVEASAGLIVFAILFCAYLFISVNGGTIFTKEIEEQVIVEAPSVSMLRQQVMLYSEKRNTFEGVRTGTEEISDPSR